MNGQDGTRPELPGGRVGVVAIVRLRAHEPDDSLLDALVDGGVQAVEVTLPSPGALDAVRRWSGDRRVVVGVGTVRTPQDAVAAAEATTRPAVLEVATERGVPVVCGALTPTEIDVAWSHGAAAVKVFPVAMVGGPAYVRAVREPLDDVLLLPTGGVDVASTEEFARAGCVGVGIGSGLVAEQLVADRDWSTLSGLAGRFVAAWRTGLDSRG